MKKIWAIVCGALRLEFELFTTLSWLVQARKDGLIEGIVLSTGYGEIERIEGLRDKLKALSIYVVESEEIEADRMGYIDVGYARQSNNVNAALNVVPDDAFVIKCRTDYSNFDLNRLKVLSNMEALKIPSFGDFRSLQKYRIAVLRSGISRPFAMHDIAYVGYKNDIKRMMIIENTQLSLEQIVWPDIFFFAGQYIHEYPLIDEFFRLIDQHAFDRLLREELREKVQDFELPPMLNKLYGLYFTLIYQNFYYYNNEDNLGDEVEISLEDVFYCHPGKGLRKDWIIENRCYDVIERVVSGRLKSTVGYNKLYQEILNNKIKDYSREVSFTKEDYDMTAEWGREYFGVEPEEWMNPFAKITDVDESNIGYSECRDILFSDYKVDKKSKEALKKITYSTQSYYGTIVENLDVFRKSDISLYERALFASTRYYDSKAMKAIAIMLLKGEVRSELQREAAFVFRRFKSDDRLYPNPMSKEWMCALGCYVIYEKNSGIEELSPHFWERLNRWYPDICVTDDAAKIQDKVLLKLEKIAQSETKDTTAESARYFINGLEDMEWN